MYGRMRGRQLLVMLFVLVLIKFLSDTGEYLALPEADYLVGNPNFEEKHTVKQESPAIVVDNAYTRNLKRIHDLRKYCEELGLPYVQNTTEIRAHMPPNKTVLYCRVNKCASTMTLELLKNLFDCDTDCLIENAKLVKQDILNGRQFMDKAFSFVVVREPYARILSTYSNIFYFPKEDWLYRSTKIIKQVRDNPSEESLKFGHDLTFAELVKYIVESYEKGTRIDEHVRPMSHRSCDPCAFRFDYVVKLETIMSDFEYLLDEWKRRKYISYYDGDILSRLREWTVYGPIKHLFRTIPLIKDSNISIYNIFVRAWSYYHITGQVSKEFAFPYDAHEIDSITVAGFRSSLEKAMQMSSNKSDLKAQRLEAMKEAYSTVPIRYIERLKNVVKTDCLLFGYEQRPELLLNLLSYNTNSGYTYYKGINS